MLNRLYFGVEVSIVKSLSEVLGVDYQSKPSGMSKLTRFLCNYAIHPLKIILENKFKYNLNLMIPSLPHC